MRAPWVVLLCLSSSFASACKVDEAGEATEENADENVDETAGTDEFDQGTDTEGGTLPWDDFKALCEQQSSRAACDAVPSQPNDDGGSNWCAWVVEVPAQLDGDTCSFGAPISQCRADSFGGDMGCADGSIDCAPGELGWTRMDGDTLWIGRGSLCESGATMMPCTVSPDSSVSGAPECACLCDPSFPE